jgi:hypothetical protein
MIILTALIAANIDDLLVQTKSAAHMKHLLIQCGDAFLGLSEIAINRRIESVQYRVVDAIWRFVSDAMAADAEILEVPASRSYAEVVTRDLRNRRACRGAHGEGNRESPLARLCETRRLPVLRGRDQWEVAWVPRTCALRQNVPSPDRVTLERTDANT